MSKWVIHYNEESKQVITSKKIDEDATYYKAILKKRISLIKFLWYWIKNKRFRRYIESCIQYSIIHHNDYRGNLSSDIVVATMDRDFYEIWKEKNK